MGRQHSGETGGSYAMEGVIRSLLEDSPQAI